MSEHRASSPTTPHDVALTTVADDPEPLARTEGVTALMAELVRDGVALGWTDPPSANEIAALLRELRADSPADACGVFADVAGELVGFGYWRRCRRPTYRRHADIEKGAVSPAHAGRGVGRLLLRRLVAEARRAGVEQLTLDFRGDNTVAERLYLSEGFREYGRLPRYVDPGDGSRHDSVLHVLDLTARRASSG
ncbi:MAG: GNAT family N-acetyltransferase [Nesterenkonia sp.]|uniref:GNAT family N-acetyltransferase n=1 Tax=Nesterenkonia marinintestina TaxID=2979865 RepID=UPI0021BFFF5E|nr:GNAT family N-acetyltransferase [Nesterenkonia sp. GX14115]MDO5493276.1 GNAT family N-acetyltransferase [Nesterenkonia sp.]